MQKKTNADAINRATAIFSSLVGNRLADKYKAVEILHSYPDQVDHPTLRTLAVKAISETYTVGKENVQDDQSIARTRSWLLGVLGRVSSEDKDATDLVAKHVDPAVETNPWGRYWALEGLISSENPRAEDVARKVGVNDPDLLVSLLASAYLAALGDRESMDKILSKLDDPDNQWPALRALRVVPLAAAVSRLCRIVEEAGYTDEAYDAIMALGEIPDDSPHADAAAHALSSAILSMRGSPWKDSLRTGAIIGLGKLKVESSGPLLLEELIDDNPAIVREAARSTEKIMGLQTTVARVVEVAARMDASAIEMYGRALRWLDRSAVAEELERLMISGTTVQQDCARALLSEIGGAVAFEKLRARTSAMKQYTDVFERTEAKIRELFETSLHEAQRGFQVAVVMDVVVFLIGACFLVTSAVFALQATGGLEKWAGVGLSGGVGVLGVLYGVLIANPRKQVRESVDHLMQLKIVFLAYLRRLHQADQAYTRRLLDDEPITIEQVKAYSDAIGLVMESTMLLQNRAGSGTASKAADESDGD